MHIFDHYIEPEWNTEPMKIGCKWIDQGKVGKASVPIIDNAIPYEALLELPIEVVESLVSYGAERGFICVGDV